MKAIVIFLGFLATISILSRSNPDAVRTIAPTPAPRPIPVSPSPGKAPAALRSETIHSSRLEVSGPLGEKKKHGRSVAR